MKIMPYVFTLLAVGGIAAGQILFKMTAGKITGRPMMESARDLSTIIPFGIALFIYASATVFWVLALRDLPLSRAYMFMAASFIIVPLVSVRVFGETLSTGYFIGLALIIAGLFVTQTFR